MRTIDDIVRANSAFKSLDAMTDTHPNYRPSIYVGEEENLIMANAYDEMMTERGDPRRAFRYGTPFKKTYVSLAKEFKRLGKEAMADARRDSRGYYFKYRGCEIIALDADGERHGLEIVEYLDVNEVSGKRIKYEVEAALEAAKRYGHEPPAGFGLAGGLDAYESFEVAMKYPDDYEPMYDSYDVDFTLEEME